MKKIFTIALVLMVFLSFGQRPGVVSSLDMQKSTFGVVQTPKTEVDTLIPGNWANATGASVYWFGEEVGYVFGTNTNGDKAYGQQFSVDEPMHLTGGIFWIAYADGTVGDVVFTVWDFVDGAPGEVLGSKAIALTDVVGSTSLDGAMVVTFDDPIAVDGDFVVGVDFSGLEGYVPNTKRLGQVSSQIGMGGNLGLVWVKESDDGWFDVMGYTNPIDVDLGIFPFVVPAGGGDGFSVTFNVDMNDVEGFDPAIHEVWVTGNFAGWNEPGTGNSVQMALAPPAKEGEVETFYFEGFEDWSTTEPGVLPEGWIQKRTASLTDEPTTDATTPYWVANNPDSNPFGGGDNPDPNAWQTYVKTGEGSMITGYTTPDFTWAISPEITIPQASDINLTYWKWYQHNAGSGWFSNYHVMVLADGVWENLESFVGSSGAPANLFASEVELSLDDYSGKTIKIAFVYEYTDGYQMAIDDIKITGTGGGQSDDLIYTATVNNIAAGELEYKYFSDAFGEGWDGGEWDGNPNRSVMIEEDTVLNNVWGDLVVSVDEIQLDMVTKVYPNPVRNTLFIESGQQIDYLRMFDLAGRVVYQAEVMDNQTTIDANLLGGGLYILQMVSGQQVKTHKIQVVK
ncbi:MAG: T9SS type A sorting domain-containing protein [Bacteroidales bacterium]|nr:T9SS type A sorting domain-containing protein [Bacteroidales bacterium]